MRRRGAVRGVVLALALIVPPASLAHAEPREISARRAVERKVFTDAEIATGFFKVAFGAEMGFGGPVDRIRKYSAPVRVYVDSQAAPDRRAAVDTVIRDIRTRIANLDIAITDRRDAANFVVRL